MCVNDIGLHVVAMIGAVNTAVVMSVGYK